MTILLVGVSHRTAALPVRERIAFRGAECASALDHLLASGSVVEGVLLSTCNRTEFYLRATEPDAPGAVQDLLTKRLGEDASPYLYVRRDRDAVAHLFSVASGLDSMVFGESQIQGQVKAAWQTCRATSGAVLNRLFHSAAGAASRVRTETTVGRGAGSVSSAAVQLAKKIFGSLQGRRAMVLGAGDVAEVSLQCLAGEGVRVALVANRTFERAQEIAARHSARALHYDECWSELHEVDVLICSTAAPRPIVHCEHIVPALKRRGSSPLCILDIAVPRDVSPDVGNLENVFLYDIDDLHSVANATMDIRRGELPLAEAIVAGETERFWMWLAGLEAVPVLMSVREEMDRLRLAELKAAQSRFAGLTSEQMNALEEFSRALMSRFLHGPTVRLREAAGNGRGLGVIDAARYLFGVEPKPEQPDPPPQASNT